jgi:hypothetical protein
VIVGFGFTVTVTTAVAEHPLVEPVTVYVVVAVGETLMLAPEPNGPDGPTQLYTAAPPALKVVLWPTQIVAGVAEAVTTGIGITFTVTVAVTAVAQPAVVPETV